jgi:hypothetical protein
MTESGRDVSPIEALRFGIVFAVTVSAVGAVVGIVLLTVQGVRPAAPASVIIRYGVQFLFFWIMFGAAYRYLGGKSPF